MSGIRWGIAATAATVLVAALTSASPLAAQAASSTSVPPSTQPTGSVIVLLKDGLADLPPTRAHTAERRSEARGQQDSVLKRVGMTDKAVQHLSLANAFVANVDARQSAELAADPDVAAIVPNEKVAVPQPPAVPKPQPQPKPDRRAASGQAPPSSALCPADPNKPLLEPEALSLMRAKSTDGSRSAQDIATGTGVKIAVMAEGLDPNAPDYIRPDGTSSIVDYQDFSGEPADSFGQTYGEEIFGDASSIAAQGRVVHDLSKFVDPSHALPANCDIRILGVAPGAGVVALKVLGTGTLAPYTIASNVIQAIDYAVTVDHVDIISESIGALGFPDAGTADAVQQFNDAAIAAGVTVIASSGDAGARGTIGSPASDPKVISAAGSTSLRADVQTGIAGATLSNGHWVNGNIAAFSSGGFTESGTVPVLTAPADSGFAACTDSTALPGCTTMATDPNTGAPYPSSIELFGGTSEAGPFIAGVGALAIQAYRDTHRGASPTPALLRQILTGSARDLGAPGTEQGAGQVDALNAVRLAQRAGLDQRNGPATGAQLLLSSDQIGNEAAPGAPVTNRLTVTNIGGGPVTMAPAIDTLEPVAAPDERQVTLDPKTDPSFPGPHGEQYTYKKVTFPVGRGIDHFTIAGTFAANTEQLGQALSFSSHVSITLLDPDGDYVMSSRPQGMGSGNYANLAVDRPKPGEWTAIVATWPNTISFFGTPLPLPPFAGPVRLAVTQQRWTTAGTVAPAAPRLAPGRRATLTLKTKMPLSGGDSSLTLHLGVPTAAGGTSVPITQRVVIPTASGVGRFTGGVTGGNGRSLQPAQTETYAFDVAKGHRAIGVSVATHATDAVPPYLTLVLIDPNGQAQSLQNDAGDAAPTPGTAGKVAALVADPVPGRWRAVIVVNQPVSGSDLVVPYTGTITMDPQPADGHLIPNDRKVTLPKGTATTFNVKIDNLASATTTYAADARTPQTEVLTLPSQHYNLPTTDTDLEASPGLIVPPMTTKITGTATSDLPIQAELTSPTAGFVLAGPSAVGSAAKVSGGVASSTATMTVSGDYLTAGTYGLLPALVGPFGPEGGPKGTATTSGTATTRGFDTTVTAPGGDPFLPGATGPAGAATPLSVPADSTGTLPITITPDAPVGTVVKGTINIVTIGLDATLIHIALPEIWSSDQVIASIPFEYTVGRVTLGSPSSAP